MPSADLKAERLSRRSQMKRKVKWVPPPRRHRPFCHFDLLARRRSGFGHGHPCGQPPATPGSATPDHPLPPPTRQPPAPAPEGRAATGQPAASPADDPSAVLPAAATASAPRGAAAMSSSCGGCCSSNNKTAAAEWMQAGRLAAEPARRGAQRRGGVEQRWTPITDMCAIGTTESEQVPAARK